jgi:4'-phosphopantetheinyl transferase
MSPKLIRFSYGEHGKPELACAYTPQLSFNQTSSGDFCVVVVSQAGALGVDVEYVNPALEVEPMARVVCTHGERTLLQPMSDHAKRLAFLNCWTRKEAYLKARGVGLGVEMNTVRVSLTPGEPAAVLETTGHNDDLSHWSMHELAVGPDYVGAVVARRHSWLSRREWLAVGGGEVRDCVW